MQELFKALANLPKPSVKRHFVKIQGKEVEVSLNEKLEIINNGENNYILQGDKPIKVERKIDRNVFPEIENLKSDPFWPTESFTWKRSE